MKHEFGGTDGEKDFITIKGYTEQSDGLLSSQTGAVVLIHMRTIVNFASDNFTIDNDLSIGYPPA